MLKSPGTMVMSQGEKTNSTWSTCCLTRFCAVAIAVVFAVTEDGLAQEPVPRHFPTAPTAYRRPRASLQPDVTILVAVFLFSTAPTAFFNQTRTHACFNWPQPQHQLEPKRTEARREKSVRAS